MFMRSIAATMAATLAAGAASAETTIRIAHATPESSPIHQALEFFKAELETRSDGGMQVEIFPGGQIGSVQQATELVQSGNIDMTTGASVLLSSMVPELSVLDQFLLFENEEQAHAVLDGPAGQELLSKMEDKGLKGMGFMELGFRHFSNSRAPLDSVEAFRGLRMRSADNPIQITAWRSVGAVPVALSWGEIYPSLQQNLIDGQESAPSSIVIERFYEVQDYVSLTGHIYWPEMWVAGLDFYNGLTDEQRALLDEVAAETVTRQRELAAKANADALAELESKGLQVNELPQEARAALGETMNAAIRDDIRAAVGPEFYDSFMTELD
ncbi:TRAP transporter substrate-binding protein [Jannaschia rubra]|uniref:TRAP transporter substrate-binding protein n=1 Tax=Jannaschia rubra TaxID=282197 RepID=UPI00248F8259|nr:TRAP transporter substrate-binding protein [Jannaschia rubra]